MSETRASRRSRNEPQPAPPAGSSAAPDERPAPPTSRRSRSAPAPQQRPATSSRRDAGARRGASAPPAPAPGRRGAKPSRRATATPFPATIAALDELAAAGAKVAVRIVDLDRGAVILAGDDATTLPIAGLGVVPLLIEVATEFERGTLHPYEIIDRTTLEPVETGGVWQHLKAPALPLIDLAVLAAATGDAIATNALIDRVGLPAVRARIESMGLVRSALLDRFRDHRGPDDAPHFALGSAEELAAMFAALVNSEAISAGVSAQVAEWLSLNHDLSLVASATGLDPFAHENDDHGLLFINKTGRDDGVRVEAGVLAGPRAGVSYALIVCFDDLSIMHRLRAHGVFRALGVELMEYVY